MSSCGHCLAQSLWQARSQDFVQEGANLPWAQGTPYQNPKTPRIWPTIFGSELIHFLFSYFTIKFCFIFPLRGAMALVAPSPLGYVPALWSLFCLKVNRRLDPSQDEVDQLA